MLSGQHPKFPLSYILKTMGHSEEPSSNHPQGRYLLVLSFTALGVVYGDIGTSPLYAIRECFYGPHALPVTTGNVLGVLSLIFWSLVLVISIKYLAFILLADNQGEGGILALTALVSPARTEARGGRRLLILMGLFGAALLYGDGMITPAISVLSAVEGLEIVTPVFAPYVIPITVVILIALFLCQHRGTAGVGAVFGPITLVWFAVLAGLGVAQIIREPIVLGAVSPHHAIAFFLDNGWTGFLVLGAVFLVVTGGEALYADMGHFGTRPIRLAWFVLVLPALLLNYFGQGALLLARPETAQNPFYLMAPAWALIPLVVLATAATVIASQAIITGVFSLAKQAIELGYLPPMRIRYTSEHNEQHIYVGRLNWLLMIACIAVVLGFEASERLASAYGIAVAFAMVTTSILFIAQVHRAWNWPAPAVWGMAIAMLAVDLSFAAANMTKIHDGGWLPLSIAGVIIFVMVSWRRGLEGVVAQQVRFTEPLDSFVGRKDRSGDVESPRTAIFLSRAGAMTPVALSRLSELLKIRFDSSVIVSVWIASRPRVSVEDRVKVTAMDAGFVRVDLRFGYMQQIDVPAVLGPALSARGIDPEAAVYVIGHERIIPPDEVTRPKDVLAHAFAFLARNAERSVDRFGLPRARTVEIGYPVKL